MRSRFQAAFTDYLLNRFAATWRRAILVCTTLLPVAVPTLTIAQQMPSDIADAAENADQSPAGKKLPWKDLFDGTSLNGWSKTSFGGEGDVVIKAAEGQSSILMDDGHPLTGITFVGTKQFAPEALPKIDYEIELEARRIQGSDFFCGLTFPYGDSHCTLILGGWGGQLVGLSSLDGKDASQNETTDYVHFTDGKWYHVLLQVNDGHIEARLDGKQIVTCRVRGRKVQTRPEVNLSQPLGIAAYQTQAELRKIRIRMRVESK